MTNLEEANTKGVIVENGLKYFLILVAIILVLLYGPMVFVALLGHK